MKSFQFYLVFLISLTLFSCSSSKSQKNHSDAPTFVLVHGAFQDAQGWNEVKLNLEKRGHHVIAVTLQGRGCVGDTSGASLEAYKQKVVDAVSSAQGKVYLVGHAACTDGRKACPDSKELRFCS